MKTLNKIIILNYFLLICTIAYSQQLFEKLESLGEEHSFTIEILQVDTLFTEKYLIRVEQPLNHKNPNGEKFIQRVFISHSDFSKPVVFITEGYGAQYAAHPKYINELSSFLDANQICVEHRYFNESVPDSIDWDYLTVFNAASDHHRIVEILKEIYLGKWVNTGISKGGQTAMYHRYFYPDDVDATVGYVCPLNFSVEDKRVYRFLENVGDSTCRKNIYQYQVEMLKNKDLYLPEFKKLIESKKLNYKIGIEKAYELTVFEYSFAFWQWGNFDCSQIPSTPDDKPKYMVKHLNDIASINWVSNEGIQRLLPFFVQALKEIGFYGYDISAFKEWTTFSTNPNFEFTQPEGTKLTFDPQPMQEVDQFIRHEAENMIFIYGESDPWSSTAVDLTYNSNNLKVIKPGGSHRTRISNLPDHQKKLVLETLYKWLDLEN